MEQIATRLARGEIPEGAELLKRNPVRVVVRMGDSVIKVWLRPGGSARREVEALGSAARRGVRVPALVDSGPAWIATRFVEGRMDVRDDHPDILPAIARMHDAGMLHGDLHLGNVLMDDDGPVLLDVQRARFFPWLPGLLRRRELGYFAFSLGDPLPRPLHAVRFWRNLRAHRHWRSRTRRCLVESSGFTRFELAGDAGFRHREADPARIAAALQEVDPAHALKRGRRADLYLSHGWILKRYRSAPAARRAWVNGRGLEARGIGTGQALAWVGRWLVMEDAGPTVIDWVDHNFEEAPQYERREMAASLGALLGALHGRGIYHADLKANNISWRPGAAPRLLDYDRVRFGRRVSRRRRVKNLAQLNAALPNMVSGMLRDRALRTYTETCEYTGDATRLRNAVVTESLKRGHRWAGC